MQENAKTSNNMTQKLGSSPARQGLRKLFKLNNNCQEQFNEPTDNYLHQIATYQIK